MLQIKVETRPSVPVEVNGVEYRAYAVGLGTIARLKSILDYALTVNASTMADPEGALSVVMTLDGMVRDVVTDIFGDARLVDAIGLNPAMDVCKLLTSDPEYMEIVGKTTAPVLQVVGRG